jgi:hypothetical protein
MSLLEKIYRRMRGYYSRDNDSPLGIAITFSFVCVAALFAVLSILDLFLLESKIQSIYESNFGSFTFRILIVPIIILILLFTRKFKKYDSKNNSNENE